MIENEEKNTINMELKNKARGLVQLCYYNFKTIEDRSKESRDEIYAKEEDYWKPKFRELGINPSIISMIYQDGKIIANVEKINEIKSNIEKYITN